MPPNLISDESEGDTSEPPELDKESVGGSEPPELVSGESDDDDDSEPALESEPDSEGSGSPPPLGECEQGLSVCANRAVGCVRIDVV